MGAQLNEDKMYVVYLTLSPSAVSASESIEQTFTLTNLKTTDFITDVIKPTTQNGLSVGGYRASAANTLAINFVNASTSSITPTSGEQYQIGIWRPEKTYTAIPL